MMYILIASYLMYHVGVNRTNHAAWTRWVMGKCILLDCLPFEMVPFRSTLEHACRKKWKKGMVAHRDHSTAQVGAKTQQVVE